MKMRDRRQPPVWFDRLFWFLLGASLLPFIGLSRAWCLVVTP